MNSTSDSSAPTWTRTTLIAAAIYNLAWGTWIILRPDDLFVMTGIEPPNYPGIWQCVGMIVGVYGIGYGIASRDPMRHWPITLVGLMGKIFGPIGFAFTVLTISPDDRGYLPLSWGATIVTNDLIWWIPFTAILYQTFKSSIAPPASNQTMSIAEANASFVDQHGHSIAELSDGQTIAVLFLRHSGCTFCREALSDLQRDRETLAAQNVRPVLVHQGDADAAAEYLGKYDLADVSRICDRDCRLYRAYDLGRGRVDQLFGPSVWWRGFVAAIVRRHGVGKLDGDGFQMPGAFIVRDNRLVRAYRHGTAADRPDLCRLASATSS